MSGDLEIYKGRYENKSIREATRNVFKTVDINFAQNKVSFLLYEILLFAKNALYSLKI